MRRRVAPLALALLLVLAGCETNPGTTTTDLPDPETYPPGLVANGIADPTALASADVDALANASYESTTRRVVRSGGRVVGVRLVNETVTRDGERLTVVSATGRFYATRVGNYTIWANESIAVARFSGKSTHVVEESYEREVSTHRRLYGALAFDVNRTDAGYRLVATGARNAEWLSHRFREEVNISLTIRLSEHGVVESYRLEYDATVDGDRYHVVETYRLTRLENATVRRPPWVDDALRNATVVTPSNGTEA